jgi:acetylornithine deacetylase/succinyl-diaminopimelate desuccinylase-like protein
VIEVRPGAMNVVPGEAILWIDLRSTSLAERTSCRDLVLAEARRLAAERRLEVTPETLMEDPPVALDPGLARLLDEACRDEGVEPRVMDSGAGHDAMQIAQIARAGMLFVPSREGISHNPREWSTPEDIALGAQVLLDAALRLTAGDA